MEPDVNKLVNGVNDILSEFTITHKERLSEVQATYFPRDVKEWNDGGIVTITKLIPSIRITFHSRGD